jgi:hypothetical protein
MTRTTLILFLVGIFSCTSNTHTSPHEAEDYRKGSSHTYSPLEPWKIEASNEVTLTTEEKLHQFQRMNNDLLLGDSILYYVKENQVVAHHIHHNTLRIIEIPDFELTSDISHYYPISPDSLLLITRVEPTLLIVNSQGQVIFKEKLPYAEFSTDNSWFKKMAKSMGIGSHNFNLVLLRDLYFDSKSKQVHIPIVPVDYLLLDQMETAQTMGVYDLTTRKWNRLYGRARGLMRFTGMNNYGGFFDHNYVLIRGDSAIISYPISHHVFIVNHRTDSLLTEFPAHPAQASDIAHPINRDMLIGGDFGKLTRYYNSTPFYGPLYYHQAVKRYTRVYFEKQSSAHENDGNYHINRMKRLLVFNEKFQKITEIELDNSIFQNFKFLPTPQGFLVAETHRQREMELEVPFRIGYSRFYQIQN